MSENDSEPSESEPASEPAEGSGGPGFFAKIKSVLAEGMAAQKELGGLKKSDKADEATTADLRAQQGELVMAIGELVVEKGHLGEFPEQESTLTGLDKESRTVEKDLAESKKGLEKEEAAIAGVEEDFAPKIEAADGEVKSAGENVAATQGEMEALDSERVKHEKTIKKLGSQIDKAAGAEQPPEELGAWEEERSGLRASVADLLKAHEVKEESLEDRKKVLAEAKSAREKVGEQKDAKLKPHKEKLATFKDAMPPLEEKLAELAAQRKECIESLGTEALEAKLSDKDVKEKVAAHEANLKTLEGLAEALGERDQREAELKPVANKMKLLLGGFTLVVVVIVVLVILLMRSCSGM